MRKWEVFSGKSDPNNNYVGYHAIGYKFSGKAGAINVWFGGTQEIKTEKEAQVIAELLCEKLNDFEQLKEQRNDNRNY